MKNHDDVLESRVETRLFNGVTERGGIPKKIVAVHGWAKWPDRIILWKGGVTHWVECKRPKGGAYEPGQQAKHRKLRRYGFTVFTIWNPEQVDKYLLLCEKLGLTGRPSVNQEQL